MIDFLKEAADAENEYDLDYICCVLFPEHYPAARVPSKFSIPSALFTHRFSMYISTGLSGAGVISFLPLDTTFSCIYSNVLTSTYEGNSGNALLSNILYYTEADSRYIANNYSQVRLVGASMRM